MGALGICGSTESVRVLGVCDSIGSLWEYWESVGVLRVCQSIGSL